MAVVAAYLFRIRGKWVEGKKMNRVTYEIESNENKLEEYEWDYLWWEQTQKQDAVRALYVGDSISFGTFPKANSFAASKMLFHNLATSKSIDNPFLIQMLQLYANQPGEYQVVLFNNGLHGWHIEDEVEYQAHYEKTMKELQSIFPHSKIVIVTTTSVADKERNARVQKRNESAKRVADKMGFQVIDLHAISEQYKTLQSDDGVHFTEEGYMAFAQYIVKQIEGEVLP